MTDTNDMDAEAVTAEIGKAREGLSRSAHALAAKTDVRRRARRASKKTVGEVKDTASSAVDNVKNAAHRAQDKIAGGPAMVAREAVSDIDRREMAMRPMPWVLAGAAGGIAAVVWIIWRRRS
jgi:hypothetical protein